MSGATPKGIGDERQAAQWVREMFGQVAPRYDLLNHLLSFHIDRWWRARTVALLKPVLRRPDALVLDLCCGTADLAIALRRAGPARVLASDFCHPMLKEAGRKAPGLPLFEADGLRLPVASGAFDLITIAFGFRNFANYEQALAELRRALKPGGTLALLEFSTPPNALIARAYGFYSNHVLPRIGAAISRAPEAYSYLPESVRKFPGAGKLASMMEEAGFRDVRYRRMSFGIVALHTGVG